MAITATLECPSGAVFKIQALAGRSIDKLVEYASEKNRKGRTEAGYMYLMVNEAVLEVLNTGSYPSSSVVLGPNGILKPSELLLGDISFILAHTRIITTGPEMSFEFSCPECKHKNNPVANLEGIQGQAYTAECLELFQKGSPHVFSLEGAKVSMMPVTGKTLEYQAKAQKSTDAKAFSLVQAAVINRVSTLEYPENKAAIADWIQGLDFLALADLQTELDTLDGGLELSLEVKCEDCGHVTKGITVPLIRPLEAKEAARPTNRAYLRSLKESGASPDFSASRKRPTSGETSSASPE